MLVLVAQHDGQFPRCGRSCERGAGDLGPGTGTVRGEPGAVIGAELDEHGGGEAVHGGQLGLVEVAAGGNGVVRVGDEAGRCGQEPCVRALVVQCAGAGQTAVQWPGIGRGGVAARASSSPIPPQLDITIGHPDLRQALQSAGTTPAAERGALSMQATIARRDLPEILAMPPVGADREMIKAWVTSLDDATVVTTLTRIAQVNPDRTVLLDYLRELCAEAHAYQSRIPERPGHTS